jgi:hypothetical protein
MASKKNAKQVQVIARYAHKTDGKLNGIVTYLIRSSNGVDTYTTTLVNGKATGCGCPAHKPCYHMTQLEAIEAARQSVKVVTSEPVESTTIQPAKATDIATIGTLNASPKNWTSILPSRRKIA